MRQKRQNLGTDKTSATEATTDGMEVTDGGAAN